MSIKENSRGAGGWEVLVVSGSLDMGVGPGPRRCQPVDGPNDVLMLAGGAFGACDVLDRHSGVYVGGCVNMHDEAGAEGSHYQFSVG